MLYLLFLLKWICSIQKNYFDVKKATFFLSATVYRQAMKLKRWGPAKRINEKFQPNLCCPF